VTIVGRVVSVRMTYIPQIQIPTFLSLLVGLRQRGDRFGASGLGGGGGGNGHFAEPGLLILQGQGHIPRTHALFALL